MGKDAKQLYDLVKTAGTRILIELNQFSDDVCEAIPDEGFERHEALELGEYVRAVRQAVADLMTFADSKLQ